MKSKGLEYQGQTFEAFKVLPGTQDTYNAFRDLSTGKAPYKLLLCYGPTGNGKTHLSKALAAKWIASGIDCRYYDVANLLTRLKEDMNDNLTSQRLREIKGFEALILDDWKEYNSTSWQLSTLEEIINARYDARKYTVVTTNMDWKELPDRIISRFCEEGLSKFVHNQGEDQRRQRR